MTMLAREMEIREEGREEGTINTLLDLVKKGLLTVNVAAKCANMSEAEFTKRLATA